MLPLYAARLEPRRLAIEMITLGRMIELASGGVERLPPFSLPLSNTHTEGGEAGLAYMVKWRRLNGTVDEVLCERPHDVARVFDEAVNKGYEPWIRDHGGKPRQRKEF